MSNQSQKKGTAWESRICDALAAAGYVSAERRRLGGAHDRGDIAGIAGLVIEAKNTNRVELAAWVDEATKEATNDDPATLGVVWAHRRGKADPTDGYVVMTGATFLELLTKAGYR